MENNSKDPAVSDSVQQSGNYAQSSGQANRGRVIQPLSNTLERNDPQAALPLSPIPEPAKPPDLSKIYPDINQINQSSAAPNSSANQQAALAPTQRVAAQVPAVQVYAFLIIIYGIYSALAYSSIFTTPILRSTARISTAGYTYSPILILLFGMAAINIAVGIYLLIAKNIATVKALLTALLIIGGIGLFNSVGSALRNLSHINASTIVSLLISAGLLLFLWNVKSQVEVASL